MLPRPRAVQQTSSAPTAGAVGLHINELFDQSKFVTEWIAVLREGRVAAELTEPMILLFLG